MATKQTSTKDPIFTAYAATAPLLDLRFYIRYATNHASEYRQPARMALDAMCRLEAAIVSGQVKGTPASQKRIVWAVIAAFKAAAVQPVYDEAGFWAMHGRPVSHNVYNGLVDQQARKVAA